MNFYNTMLEYHATDTTYHIIVALGLPCVLLSIKKGSSCGRADSVMDSHTTVPGFKTRLVRYFLPSFRLVTTITASLS